MDGKLTVHVLFRFNKRSGKIDTTMTSLGCALLQMWALQNTSRTKRSVIFERETGTLVFDCEGNSVSEFPQINKYIDVKKCTEFGIPLNTLREIKDERFDK